MDAGFAAAKRGRISTQSCPASSEAEKLWEQSRSTRPGTRIGTIPTDPQRNIFGEMRESGVRDVPIHDRGHRSSRHVEISADRR